jgi:WD40 repeat protein
MDSTADDIGTGGLPGQRFTALARPGSRAVVVGTGRHVAGAALPGIPAVAGTVSAVRDTLSNQCAMDERHVITVTDPEGAPPFLDAVNQAAARAEDVLLFYYIGHGLANLANELFLATAATTDREVMLPAEALSFAAVRGVLSASRARHIVVVLDCCFSGRAAGVSGAVADAFELTNVQGSYLLSATSPNEQALAPEGERYTAFSGALLEFLREGDPAAPRGLTLDDAYRYLARVLPSRGAPAPQRRLVGDAGSLVMAVNPQAPAVMRPRREPASRSAPRPCPYPGLDAFTADDAKYFYGRERLTGEILSVLASRERNGPLAIVGRSGAGKSSLLQAGLLPAIKAGRLDVAGSRYWPQLVMTPGEHPLRVLARRLSAGTGRDEASVAAALAADPGELPEIVAAPRAGRTPDGLVLCVDQFEEVFTACVDEAERHAFIQALCAAAANGAAARIQVILGLRADFYGRCLDYPELAPMVTAGQIPVRPMSRDELLSAIEDPAGTAGLRLEEGLARRLLLDLESAEGPGREADSGLPLLAFVLQATWQQSDKQVLTLSDYEATGGIWGAVTQRAEACYGGLGQEKDAAKLLLLGMVQLGDGTDDVRRRISVADLLAGRSSPEQTAIGKALDVYVGARLVTVDGDTAEIAHEALLRAWPRLRQWIEEDRKELLDHQRLAQAARLWRSGGGPLYTGSRLDEARVWLAAEGPVRRSLSPLEQDFVRASVRAMRRRRNRRWSFVTTAVAAALALAVGGVYAVQQRTGNQNSQAVESSVVLAQEADNLRATDPAGAMWLSLAAYNSSKTAQARTELYDSLTTPYPLTLPGGGQGSVDSVAYSPDGTTAAAAWQDGIVRVWSVSDPLRPVLVATLKVPSGGIDSLAFSPDGGILAVHALDLLQLWKLGAGPQRPALLSDTAVTEGAPHSKDAPPWLPVAFSPDGRVVVTGADDGRFRMWNVSDPVRPALIATVAASSQPLNAVAFSPGGDTLAVAIQNSALTGEGGRVRLWDVRNPAKPVPASTLAVSSALAIAFSPVGHLLVAAGSDDDVYAWNVEDAKRPTTVQVSNQGNGSSLYSVAFHPGSEVFVTADSGGSIETWAGTPGADITDTDTGDLPDSSDPNSVAFSPSGEQILAGDFGGSVTLWVTLTSPMPGSFDIGFGGSPYNVNGTVMAVESPGESILHRIELWDVTDPLHPELDSVLPGSWTMGAFLPGGNTLITFTNGNYSFRLWNVTNPRHPQSGAELPDNAATGYTAATWDASDNGLLLVAGPDDVLLWDVRNPSHPELDSTLTTNPVGEMGFLSDQLVAVNTKPSPASSELELWDIANPRHPVVDGPVPNGDADSALLIIPSRHLLTETNAQARTGTTLWSLGDPRKPSILDADANMDPDGLNSVSNDTWIALTRDDETINVWNVSNPNHPGVTAALPVGTGYDHAGVYTADTPEGLLAGMGFIPLSGTGEEVYLMQVRSDGGAVSDYAQLAASTGLFVFSPDGKFLATNFDTSGGSGFEAFYPQDPDSADLGILYPLNTDSIYEHLCSIATQTPPDASWSKYLPATYYRPACS